MLLSFVLPSISFLSLLSTCQVFYFFCFSVRLLSVLRDHSVCSSAPQRPTTSDFEGFLSQILSITFFVLSFIFQKEPVFPFLLLSAKQGNYWYQFVYNVFGMMRSVLDWGLNPGPPTLSRRR